ncbi:hypothetical protein, partial [Aeromonas veronii]|uniref:hypothetical protein n=1 Tax=Aeromonas veronii TaxID=654 RepID=UPI003BA1EAFA
NTMTGYRQQKPKNGLTKCPDLVDHYKGLSSLLDPLHNIPSIPEPKANYWISSELLLPAFLSPVELFYVGLLRLFFIGLKH